MTRRRSDRRGPGVTPALWEGLRLLAVSAACILGAGALGGAVIAEWQSMRDYEAGRNQPRPVWTAEERWGG